MRRALRPLLAGISLAACLYSGAARAETYSSADFSNVVTEEDIRDLLAQGDITENEIDVLLELLLDPVDVNRANRDTLYQLPYVTYELADAIIAYRSEKGFFPSLDGLLDVPGMTRDLRDQLAPFAEARPALVDRLDLRGDVKVRTAYTTGYRPRDLVSDADVGTPLRTNDDVLRSVGVEPIPETYIRVRTRVGADIQTGLVLLEQASIGRWVYDPSNLNFQAKWGNPTLTVEKAFVAVERERYEAVVGSYSAGFGQRLTFDNSQRNRPKGFYADDRINNAVGFNAPERLFGAAFSWLGGRAGPIVLSGTAFASFRPYDLYESRFVVAPPEGVIWGGLAAGTSPHAILGEGVDLPYVTFPNLYTEGILGGHLDAELPGKHRLGLTAYGARIHKRAPIDFTGTLPDRPMFGAVGVDGTSTFGQWDLAYEAAVMDSGGVGAFIRGARSWDYGEVVTSLRHYGTDFDNPHSRGTAQADTYSPGRPDSIEPGGDVYDPEAMTSFDRDRDEQGARIEGYYQTRSRVTLKGYGDLWRQPSSGIWDADTLLRADITINDNVEIDLVSRYQDRNLAIYGRQYAYDRTIDDDPNEILDDNGAAGARITAGAYAVLTYIPQTTLWLHYRRYYEDSNRRYVEPGCSVLAGGYRVGNIGYFKAVTDLPGGLRSTFRARYMDEDFYGNSGQRELEGYGQLEWRSPDGKYLVGARYSVLTQLRDPGDADVQFCSENPPAVGLADSFPTTQIEDNERLRTPQQTVLATFQYRF